MKQIKDELDHLVATFEQELEQQKGLQDLESMRVRFMGKKGPLTAVPGIRPDKGAGLPHISLRNDHHHADTGCDIRSV